MAIRPEAQRLVTPASPHLAAEIDGVNIDVETLAPPLGDLIVEGAGGALVPVTRTILYADLFARWQIPVIVCARTGLGTINHSLLTIEALKSRGVRSTASPSSATRSRTARRSSLPSRASAAWAGCRSSLR